MIPWWLTALLCAVAFGIGFFLATWWSVSAMVQRHEQMLGDHVASRRKR